MCSNVHRQLETDYFKGLNPSTGFDDSVPNYHFIKRMEIIFFLK